jgi:hypothetical protein
MRVKGAGGPSPPKEGEGKGKETGPSHGGGRWKGKRRKDVPPPRLDERLVRMKKGGRKLAILGVVKGLLSETSLVAEAMGVVGPDAVAMTCNPAEVRSLRVLARTRPEGFDLRLVEDVRALGRILWGWDCECGTTNPPDRVACEKCRKARPGTPEGALSGRATEGPISGHGAVDNIWVETDTSPKPAEGDEGQFGIGDVLTHHDEIFMGLLAQFGETRFPSPAFLAAVTAAGSQGLKPRGLDMDEDEFTDVHVNEVGYLDLLRSSRAVRRLEKKGMFTDTPAEFAVEWDRRLNGFGGYLRVEGARAAHMAGRLDSMSKRASNILCFADVELVSRLAGGLLEGGWSRA